MKLKHPEEIQVAGSAATVAATEVVKGPLILMEGSVFLFPNNKV